jgi:hypothetical protein
MRVVPRFGMRAQMIDSKEPGAPLADDDAATKHEGFHPPHGQLRECTRFEVSSAHLDATRRDIRTPTDVMIALDKVWVLECDARASVLNASPLCDVYVVKIRHDFVKSRRYNFSDSNFRSRTQAPVFTRCLGAFIASALARALRCHSSNDALRAQRIGECKTEIRAIDASTGKAVTNFLRPPETL